MIPRRPLALLALAMLALLAAGHADAHAKKGPLCQRATGDTVTANADARVYTTTKRGRNGRSTVRVYACEPGSRKIRRLETFKNTLDFTDRIATAALGGDRWLVLQIDNESGVALRKTHTVYSLRSGKRVAQFFEDEESSADVEPIVATPDGAFARLRFDTVIAYDASGRRVLDPGPATDLAAAGNTIYWTSGDAPRSARLSGRATS